MPFPKNTARIRSRAALDTAKKIALEPHLATSMRRILNNMVKSFRVTYPAHQETILPHRFHADVNAALRDQYRRVTRTFLSSHRDEANQLKKGKADAKVNDSINAEMQDYILKHSDKQTSLIIKTTQSDLDVAIKRAVNTSIQTGAPLDSRSIADVVAKDYTRKIAGRAKVISLTETQSLAEKTKQVELENLDDLEEFAGYKFVRIWVAILDQVTRDWHAEADGQQVGINEPYIVNGEELEMPGDPNGSPENICNCRCASVPADGDDDSKSIIIVPGYKKYNPNYIIPTHSSCQIHA